MWTPPEKLEGFWPSDAWLSAADGVVEVPGAGFRISGYIDRLDVSDCGARARVVDYKGGKCPKSPVQLDGGSELQRCLYSYAVRSLMGDHVEVEAALFYPRAGEMRPLDDGTGTLDALTGHLLAARESLAAGRAFRVARRWSRSMATAMAWPIACCGWASAAHCFVRRSSAPTVSRSIPPLARAGERSAPTRW
ncbi:hypothetical protein CKY28_17550 [Sphingomonas lenta]|uniref:PD-(D/E)XK endonuclease-like domain-containing protein n=1 Tax=Sphingomonas lenta TaxID=1141887 RepID=A0A2A2SB43_9SPHN|nr:hypothetical protein CKY28_17550 [Sphingomonas lenta]